MEKAVFTHTYWRGVQWPRAQSILTDLDIFSGLFKLSDASKVITKPVYLSSPVCGDHGCATAPVISRDLQPLFLYIVIWARNLLVKREVGLSFLCVCSFFMSGASKGEVRATCIESSALRCEGIKKLRYRSVRCRYHFLHRDLNWISQ